jgi:hypothetical protein
MDVGKLMERLNNAPQIIRAFQPMRRCSDARDGADNQRDQNADYSECDDQLK